MVTDEIAQTRMMMSMAGGKLRNFLALKKKREKNCSNPNVFFAAGTVVTIRANRVSCYGRVSSFLVRFCVVNIAVVLHVVEISRALCFCVFPLFLVVEPGA